MAIAAPDFHADSSLVTEIKASPNHGERKNDANIDMLVLHYTGMQDATAAIKHLCQPGTDVSAHYVVLEDGQIVQCVAEARRAWHAGQAFWNGETDINSCSIGIEIVNPGHDYDYPDFPRRQIAAVTALCRSILTRHRIRGDRVVGHSDVSPTRKRDPGEKFPWRILHRSGIGHWVEPAPLTPSDRVYVLGESSPAVSEAQALLARYGYAVGNSNYVDGATRDALAAFQRHFRPQRVDGALDSSTLKTLKDLLAAREGADGAAAIVG
jgi:N-acetylmuramoyl-L-alanine amidase